jgi:hypothetical protein
MFFKTTRKPTNNKRPALTVEELEPRLVLLGNPDGALGPSQFGTLGELPTFKDYPNSAIGIVQVGDRAGTGTLLRTAQVFGQGDQFVLTAAHIFWMIPLVNQ